MIRTVLEQDGYAAMIECIAAFHSYEEQREKLIEEMAELMAAIKHLDRKENRAANRKHFHEELGDVLILLEQIVQCYLDVDDDFEVANWIKQKLLREIGRIENQRLRGIGRIEDQKEAA